MKTRNITVALALLAVDSFTACKKDYTCTCTTVIASVSVTDKHAVDNATYSDAKKPCSNYEGQANNSYPGGTTCHL